MASVNLDNTWFDDCIVWCDERKGWNVTHCLTGVQ
jgi:hypothetical protein